MRKCPFCAEEIRKDAIKCRFCGEFLNKKNDKGCLVGCLVAFALTLLLAVVALSLIALFAKFVIFKFFFKTPYPEFDYFFSFPGSEDFFQEFNGALREFLERFKNFIDITPHRY